MVTYFQSRISCVNIWMYVVSIPNVLDNVITYRSATQSTTNGGQRDVAPTFVKFVFKVTGYEVTYACKGYQLCVVLKTVIDGAVHGVRSILEANSTD